MEVGEKGEVDEEVAMILGEVVFGRGDEINSI